MVLDWTDGPGRDGRDTPSAEEEAYRHALYFSGKVSRAVELLANGPGDIRERLLGAGMQMLIIPPECIPEHLREDLRWVKKQLTRYGVDGTSGREKLHATMRRSRNSSGVKIAQRILKIEMRYEDWLEENSRCRHKHEE